TGRAGTGDHRVHAEFGVGRADAAHQRLTVGVVVAHRRLQRVESARDGRLGRAGVRDGLALRVGDVGHLEAALAALTAALALRGEVRVARARLRAAGRRAALRARTAVHAHRGAATHATAHRVAQLGLHGVRIDAEHRGDLRGLTHRADGLIRD